MNADGPALIGQIVRCISGVVYNVDGLPILQHHIRYQFGIVNRNGSIAVPVDNQILVPARHRAKNLCTSVIKKSDCPRGRMQIRFAFDHATSRLAACVRYNVAIFVVKMRFPDVSVMNHSMSPRASCNILRDPDAAIEASIFGRRPSVCKTGYDRAAAENRHPLDAPGGPFQLPAALQVL